MTMSCGVYFRSLHALRQLHSTLLRHLAPARPNLISTGQKSNVVSSHRQTLVRSRERSQGVKDPNLWIL